MLRLIHSRADSEPEGSIDDEALRWVVLLTSGESTEADHETFRVWRDHSPEHAYALARARSLSARVTTALPRSRMRGLARVPRRVKVGLPLAASVLISLGVADRYASDWRYDQATGRGERRVLALADGSRVTMAGDTALDVRFANGVRRVVLARGQAVFRVVHDARRPFVVYTGEHSVRDVGTVFDVARADGKVQVVVAEGVVEAASDDRRATLRAGQQITLDDGGLGHVRPVDARSALSWSRGRLTFQDRSLDEILAALRPHYAGRILLLNRAAGRRRLSVVINIDKADDWLTGLAQAKAVNLTRIGSVVLLT